jgi:hypothetical protein
MADHTAAGDETYVCLACGKTSRTKYGLDRSASPGWDESCMLNSVLYKTSDLVFAGPEKTRVASIREGALPCPCPYGEHWKAFSGVANYSDPLSYSWICRVCFDRGSDEKLNERLVDKTLYERLLEKSLVLNQQRTGGT